MNQKRALVFNLRDLFCMTSFRSLSHLSIYPVYISSSQNSVLTFSFITHQVSCKMSKKKNVKEEKEFGGYHFFIYHLLYHGVINK